MRQRAGTAADANGHASHPLPDRVMRSRSRAVTLRIAGAEEEPQEDPSLPPGDGRTAFSLVLLGYRNDLSRHRVLALLRDRVDSLPPEPPLPCTIAARIDGAQGAQLAREFEDEGAVVLLEPLPDAPRDARRRARIAAPAPAPSEPTTLDAPAPDGRWWMSPSNAFLAAVVALLLLGLLSQRPAHKAPAADLSPPRPPAGAAAARP